MDTTVITKPKMLTINETAKTGILSEWALRALVKQGKIPGIYVGNRFLINYDRLCDWLNNSGKTSADNTSH
ncbi:MAG: hypothetical protein IJB52_03735 [Clostridia bacterium]|nr:hypothetical protein [Clostridia bacterium]